MLASQLRSALDWSALAALGEQRLLRVSYVVLALVPAVHVFLRIWNVVVDTTATTFGQVLTELEAQAERIRADEDMSSSQKERISAWLDSARPLFGEARKLQLSADDQKLHMPWWFRTAFISSLLISIANFLYVAFCPREIRAFSDSNQTSPSLGQRADWSLHVLRVRGQATKENRALLVQYMLSGWDCTGARPNDPAIETLTRWEYLARSRALARLCCFACYFVGLTLALVELGRKAILVAVT